MSEVKIKKKSDCLKPIKDFVNSVTDDVVEKYAGNAQFVGYMSYVKDAKQYLKCHCFYCGYDFEHPNDKKISECPYCKVKTFRQVNQDGSFYTNYYYCRTYLANHLTFVKETDEGVYFAEMMYDFYIKMEDSDKDDVFAWTKNDLGVKSRVCKAGLLSETFGFVFLDESDKILKSNCGQESRWANELYKLTDSDIANLDELSFNTWADVMARYCSINSANEAKKTATKKQSHKEMIADMRSKYSPKMVNLSKATRAEPRILSVLTEQTGSNTVHTCACYSCGHIWRMNNLHFDNSKTNCPNCEKELSLVYSSYSIDSVYAISYENTSLPDNDLLVRMFEVMYTLRHDTKTNTFHIDREETEHDRFFVNDKDMGLYHVCNASGVTTATKVRMNSYSHLFSYSYRNSCVVNSDEDLVNVFKNSCLKYSGIIEAMGIGDPRYKKVIEKTNVHYITSWFKNRNIEKLVKSNLVNISQDVINGMLEIPTTKNISVTDMLNISGPVFKMAVKGNFGHIEIQTVQRLWSEDNSLTYEDYLKYKEMGGLDIFREIKAKFNIPYKRTYEYIQTVYDHQCVEKSEALRLWKDYLHMAKGIGIKLKDSSRKYPSSLKKAHDVAMFAHRALESKDFNGEKFRAAALENKKSYGNYSYKDFFIETPMCAEDVIAEADMQKNSLRSYVNKLKEGRTAIFFIRKKEEPEVSYVTAEVLHGQLIEVNGYANTMPKDSKLNEFLEHWMKAKNITDNRRN